MTRVKHVPFSKRFPGQWRIQTKIWTAADTQIAVEGPLTTVVGELILLLLAAHKRVERPELVAIMKDLAERLGAKEPPPKERVL